MKKFPLPTTLWANLFLALFATSYVVATDTVYYYVAPEARGSGTGEDLSNAAGYLESALWDVVRERLREQSVTVSFTAGEYTAGILTLRSFGHPDNELLLKGDDRGGTVFTGDVRRHLQIRGGRNIILRHLNFTGNTKNFAIHIVGYPEDNPVENLILEHCRFYDLPIANRGGLGIAGRVTELTVRDCHFENIGESAHAHMVYNTTSGPGPLRFHNNTFIDTPGDYLRFRNRRAYAEVIGNTFISNSVGNNRPFVALIAFNREGKNVIGDDVLITNNHFQYHATPNWSWDRGIAICLSGYNKDPSPDIRYMLTPEEARTLANGSMEERRALLKEVMKINPDTLRIRDNTYDTIRYLVGFGSRADEGEGRGWEGFINLTPIIEASSFSE